VSAGYLTTQELSWEKFVISSGAGFMAVIGPAFFDGRTWNSIAAMLELRITITENSIPRWSYLDFFGNFGVQPVRVTVHRYKKISRINCYRDKKNDDPFGRAELRGNNTGLPEPKRNLKHYDQRYAGHEYLYHMSAAPSAIGRVFGLESAMCRSPYRKLLIRRKLGESLSQQIA
jgi:hypothetical protein